MVAGLHHGGKRIASMGISFDNSDGYILISRRLNYMYFHNNLHATAKLVSPDSSYVS